MKDSEDAEPMIAARLNGPGPAKYKLPGTTGYINHDGTRKKNPAYSLGKRFGSNVRNTNKLLFVNLITLSKGLCVLSFFLLNF